MSIVSTVRRIRRANREQSNFGVLAPLALARVLYWRTSRHEMEAATAIFSRTSARRFDGFATDRSML